MAEKWRLLINTPATGAWNMAADEMLLMTASASPFPVTLRFYSWDIPTLSLGYAQSIQDVYIEKQKELGWGLVRRPTGGRAILHVDEVTYSVTAPLNTPIAAGSILESYQKISKALVHALKAMGLPAENNREYELPPGTVKNGAVCFEVPSNYEITVDGKKLIGSAQARKHQALLQHGAIPLCGDLTRINQVLKYPDDFSREKENEKLRKHATTIKACSGLTFSWSDAVHYLRNGFSDEFGIEFIENDFSQDELNQIDLLVESKYSTEQWNFRI